MVMTSDEARKGFEEKNKNSITTPTPTKTPSPTATPTKVTAPESEKTIITPTQQGEVQHRNEKATPAIKNNPDNAMIVTKYAKEFNIPLDLATDLAFAESSLDHKKRAEDHGYDGNHYQVTLTNGKTVTVDKKDLGKYEGQIEKKKLLPYSSASGLFMFTNATWDTMKNNGVIPKNATYADKLDPELNAKAAMWAVSHGMLSRWNASKGNWGANYTEEELKRFY
jgi:hypothetical protein